MIVVTLNNGLMYPAVEYIKGKIFSQYNKCKPGFILSVSLTSIMHSIASVVSPLCCQYV